MNRPSEITDNAHMESFFHSMKSDVVHGARFGDDTELVSLLRSYIPYYNGVRLHSGIGYSSPVAYEARGSVTESGVYKIEGRSASGTNRCTGRVRRPRRHQSSGLVHPVRFAVHEDPEPKLEVDERPDLIGREDALAQSVGMKDSPVETPWRLEDGLRGAG